MVIKKIKISSAKRSHHVRQKKNFHKPSAKSKPLSKLDKLTHLNDLNKTEKNHKSKTKKVKNKSGSKAPPIPQRNEDSEVEADDVMDMIENDDLDYMKTINVLHVSDEAVHQHSRFRKRKKNKEECSDDEEYDDHEKEYNEYNLLEENKNMKALLPIKTKDGNVVVRSEKVDKSVPVIKNKKLKSIKINNEMKEDEIDSDEEVLKSSSDSENEENIPGKSISTADLLIKREQEIQKQKYRIGIICSGILEKPDEKMKNFLPLLEFMDHSNSDGTMNLTTIRKIAVISILELFKDIIPEYRIGFIDLKSSKVKKDTLERVNFENALLNHYKKYLQKLEKLTSPISSKKRKVGANHGLTADTLTMAELAVKCLCELLLAHPYFNYSQNVAQMLVYLSNNKSATVRECVKKTFIEIYKTDQRFDLTFFIIRRTNHLIKSKSNMVYVDVIQPLINLPIKNINLDALKEKELKQKKLEAHKSRIMNLSKKEKKRFKKLKEVDRELQETQAEENKQTKQYKLTEITKMVFTIYFRILKNDPKSKLLSSVLEGLAKYSHIINIDFFEDLVNTLNYLMENGELGYREQLHCIQTVFVILSGQGEVFNIDPCRFYTHMYKNLLEVNAGKNHEDLLIIIKTLVEIVIKRRKHITHQRLAAFVKRLATLCLQVQHNGALSLLSIIKNALQFNSSLDILLDTDNSIGSGRFDPELEEPEYCNANCTTLYEISSLTRHYHPIVKKIARHIVAGVPSTGEGSLNPEISKISPEDLYTQFDSSQMAFNPPIPTPRNCEPKAKPGRHFYVDFNLENYCKNSLKEFCKSDNVDLNFCLDYWNTLETTSK